MPQTFKSLENDSIKLRTEIERLREALREIYAATSSGIPDDEAANRASDIAVRALEAAEEH